MQESKSADDNAVSFACVECKLWLLCQTRHQQYSAGVYRCVTCDEAYLQVYFDQYKFTQRRIPNNCPIRQRGTSECARCVRDRTHEERENKKRKRQWRKNIYDHKVR
jgi:hypothetical protein